MPPTVEEGPTEVAATVNTHTLLLCETLGLPDPTITWEKDSREIPNNGLRYRMHRSGSLEFSSVKVEDSGIYKCTATNEAGTADRTITLAVQGTNSNHDTLTPWVCPGMSIINLTTHYKYDELVYPVRS